MKKVIITALSFAVLGTSCRKMIEGTSGSMTTEYRQAPSFNKIHIQGNIDVFLSQDTSFSIRVEAGEHLVNFIETNVVNGEMIIHESNNNLANTKPIKVYVYGDSLENIEIEGSGNFDGDNIKANTLNILVTGSGNLNIDVEANTVNYNVKGSGNAYLLGVVNNFNALIQGSGDINAKFLQAQDVNAKITGSGNAIVTAFNSLIAEVSGSGDIDYYGNPGSLSTIVTGSGSINPH